MIAAAQHRTTSGLHFTDIEIIFILPLFRRCYLRRPPPPPRPPPPRLNPPPPREDMLDMPRFELFRALEPSKPLFPPPNASRLPPPLLDRSRVPMRSGPPPSPEPRLLRPAPPARLAPPAPSPRLLAMLPPCLPICWRALACRCARESPRAVPPNRSAVARSR